MIPRLEAEEMLNAATAAGLGAAGLDQGDARRVLRELEKRAGSSGSPAKADPRALALMGIAVTVVGPAVAEGPGDG